MIYLDNSATTKCDPEVLDTYRIVSESFFGNPSSIHSFGGQSEDLLTKTRAQAARLLNIEENELIFTSGGTEGNNLAIKGAAFQYQNRGRHLITSTVEHASTYEAFQQLEQLGFEVTYLEVDRSGRIRIEDLRKALRADTILVSLIHVNNELGTIQSVEDVGELLKAHPKILFHIDHVQGLTKVPLDFKKAHVDLATMSGHKIHGPKGTGLLYIRRGIKLSPLFAGGGQEHSFRAGTENLPGLVGMVKALRLTTEKMEVGLPRLRSLTHKLRDQLAQQPNVVIHTPLKGAAPHIMNASVKGIKAEVLIHALEEEGIIISTKSACSSKGEGASRVLLNTGMPEDIAEQAIRISLSFETTELEIDRFLSVFQKKVAEIGQVMGGHSNDIRRA